MAAACVKRRSTSRVVAEVEVQSTVRGVEEAEDGCGVVVHGVG